jgi:hypothetical protein
MPYDTQAIEVTVGPSTGLALPAVGLATSRWTRSLDGSVLELLIGLRPDHLGVELHLAGDAWPDVLARAAAVGLETATRLEVVLTVGPATTEQLEAFDRALRLAQVGVERFIVRTDGFRSAGDVLAEVRPALAVLAPRAAFGVFHGAADAASSTVVFDWTTRRSWSGQLERVVARELAERQPVTCFVSSRALGRVGRYPAGAVFALASFTTLARRGASAITYDAGTRDGILRTTSRAPFVAPSYHVLADLGECDFGQIGESTCADDASLAVLCAYTADGVRLLIANKTPSPRRATVGQLGRSVRARVLDDTSMRHAVEQPVAFRRDGSTRRTRGGRLDLELRPFAVVVVDV